MVTLSKSSILIILEKSTSKFSAPPPQGPPKFELQGNKWVVENQINQQNLVISGTELRHVVYIYNCQNCAIQVKGKVNAVTMGKINLKLYHLNFR